MKQGLFFLLITIIACTFLNLGFGTEILAQDFDAEDTLGLSGRSIENAQDNITELTANDTGFKAEDTLGLSGRSIENAQDNIKELTANDTGFKAEDTLGLSGRSIEKANK